MGDRVVNFDLSQGFTLSGTMTPTGTSGSVSYYCCSNGSARVIVLDSTGQRLSIVIPNHGTNTIHGPFILLRIKGEGKMASNVFTFDLNPGEMISGSVVSTGPSGSAAEYFSVLSNH